MDSYGWTSSTGKKIALMQGGGRHGESELLAGCYRRCLELAREGGMRTSNFPALEDTATPVEQ